MEGMFEGTCLTALDLDQDTQAALKKRMGNFHEAYIQKYYTQAQGKGDETVAIASISHQIGRKLKSQTKIEPPPGFNISRSKYPSITSVITQEAAEYGDDSLLGGASLALDLAGDDISLFSDEAY